MSHIEIMSHARDAGLIKSGYRRRGVQMQDNDLSHALGFVAAVAFAFFGRSMAMATRRPVIGWPLLWELPVVIGMGIIGAGVVDWMDLRGYRAGALIATLGYIGPASIGPLLRLIMKRNVV